jgi:phasin family protein
MRGNGETKKFSLRSDKTLRPRSRKDIPASHKSNLDFTISVSTMGNVAAHQTRQHSCPRADYGEAMFPTQDQISAAAKAHLDAQFALYTSLTGKTLESVGKLINLNFAAAKASMEESAVTARQMLAAKDPQEVISLVAAQAKPNLEKALAYGGHLAGIAGSTQAEFTKAAETQVAAVDLKFNELVDAAAGKTPAGLESFIAIVKCTLDNANAGYGQLSKTARQAVEANIAAAVNQF